MAHYALKHYTAAETDFTEAISLVFKELEENQTQQQAHAQLQNALAREEALNADAENLVSAFGEMDTTGKFKRQQPPHKPFTNSPSSSSGSYTVGHAGVTGMKVGYQAGGGSGSSNMSLTGGGSTGTGSVTGPSLHGRVLGTPVVPPPKDTGPVGGAASTQASASASANIAASLATQNAILNSQNANYFYNRANARREMGKIKESIEDVDSAIALAPFVAAYYHAKGLAYEELNDFTSACFFFTQAIERDPSFIPALYHKALCLRSLHAFTAAQECVDKAILLDPSDRRLFEARGIILGDMGNYALAYEAFTRAVEAGPITVDDLFHRSQMCMKMDRAREALDDLNAAIELAKDGPVEEDENLAKQIIASVGGLTPEQLKKKEDERKGRAADEFYFVDAELLNARSLAYKYLKKFDLAIKDLTIAIGKEELGEYYFNRGVCYHEIERYKKAVGDFTIAINKRPEDANIYYRRGLSYYFGRRYHHAIDDLDKAVSASLDNGDDLDEESEEEEANTGTGGGGDNDRTAGSQGGGRDNNGVTETNSITSGNDTESERSNPSNPSSTTGTTPSPGVGRAGEGGSTPPAQAASLTIPITLEIETDAPKKKKIKLQPLVSATLQADCVYHLGLCYACIGEHDNAVGCITQAIEIHGIHAHYVHERAKAFQMLGKNEEALRDFTVVLELQPKNAKAFFRRAFCYKAMERFDAAAHDFEMARKLDPENPMYLVNYKKVVFTDVIELEEPGDEL